MSSLAFFPLSLKLAHAFLRWYLKGWNQLHTDTFIFLLFTADCKPASVIGLYGQIDKRYNWDIILQTFAHSAAYTLQIFWIVVWFLVMARLHNCFEACTSMIIFVRTRTCPIGSMFLHLVHQYPPFRKNKWLLDLLIHFCWHYHLHSTKPDASAVDSVQHDTGIATIYDMHHWSRARGYKGKNIF